MYPLIICSHGRLIIAPENWFDRIGRIDFSAKTLRINVGRRGQAGLSWLVDANGRFHELHWRGLERTTFLQAIRLVRRVECYALAPPRSITVGELSALSANLTEAFEEAPNSAGLRAVLSGRLVEELVSRDLMLEYLGE
ncbi:hypothetical protein [Lysobacter antibioticus]|uniref:hypothetical protein n=1 Tax=Lysobacter antibioticus TaxID=84531 RepID=UPI00118741FD|nr:hypothetical protein [Lysobacter antibioticus]